jgi:hypothetical protein
MQTCEYTWFGAWAMKRKNKNLFLVIAVAIAAVTTTVLSTICFSGYLLFPASLQLDINDVPIRSQQGIALNSVSPIYFQQGETSRMGVLSLRQISLKQNPLHIMPARGVEGRFELPNGFFIGGLTQDKTTQTQTIPFGSIYPGDASHCGPVLVSMRDDVMPGTYHAKFIYWAKNVQTQEIDIALIVVDP